MTPTAHKTYATRLKALLVPVSFFIWVNLCNNWVINTDYTTVGTQLTPHSVPLYFKIISDLVYLLGSLIICYLWTKKYRLTRTELGLNRIAVKPFVTWSLLLFIGITAVSSFPVWSRFFHPILSDKSLLSVCYSALTAGIIEELVFRGVIQAALSRVYSVRSAIVIQAIFFAICHNLVRGTLFDMTEIFLIGLILGSTREKIKTIIPGMAGHALTDLVAGMIR